MWGPQGIARGIGRRLRPHRAGREGQGSARCPDQPDQNVLHWAPSFIDESHFALPARPGSLRGINRPRRMLAHDHRDDDAGEECQHGDRDDRPGEAEAVGDEAGGERTDRVAEIAPEPIDAERAGTPGRMRGVGDGGDQARVDHRRAQAEQQAADEPPFELACRRGDEQAGGLHPHAGHDQALAPPAVAQGAGGDL